MMNKKQFVLGTLFCAVHASVWSVPGYAQAPEDIVSEDVPVAASEAAQGAAKENEQLEEILVVGYSTAKKEDITGAVAAVNLDDVSSKPSGNIMQNLQGRIPGVQILTNGSPNSTATVRIRGQGLGVLGYNDPL